MNAATIAVIGLGKLGLPLALLFADRGYSVAAFDAEMALMEELQSGETRLCEPGAAHLLKQCGAQLTFAANVIEAVRSSAATFVIVPTPSAADGRFCCDAVVDVVGKIGAALKDGPRDHLVVVVSTVMPGDMDRIVRPALTNAAGGSVPLCYCPEFVALGSVLDDMRRPGLMLIGEEDGSAGDATIAIMEKIWDSRPALARMGFVNAELTKLAINTMITTRISAANQISELCDHLPGADAATVLAAVGLDRRIGPSCLAPATGFGGPCFPRDNDALIALGADIGVTTDIAVATQTINQRQAERVVEKIRHLGPTGTVAVLGLAYKAGTDVCDHSAGVAIANGLMEAGYAVRAHDPLAIAPPALGRGAVFLSQISSCLEGADVAVLCTPSPEYALLTRQDFGTMPVLDCWGLLPEMPGRHRLGVGDVTA